MRNKILHALANRPGPFLEPLFGAQPEFQPAVFAPDLEQLRALLFLNVTDTDYYLLRYLPVLEAFPEIKQQLADAVTTYRVWEFLPRGVSITGAELISGGNVAGGYLEPMTNPLPINRTYVIDFISNAYCRITAVEQGLVRNATVLASGFAPAQWLRVDWPADIPFAGPLRLSQPWVTGAEITIIVEPHRFPYGDLVNRIKANDKLNELLAQNNLAGVFHSSVDPLEQLALALLVVARANPVVYG